MATKIEETNTTPDCYATIGLKNCLVCYSNFVKNEKIDLCEECADAFSQGKEDSVIICGNWGGSTEIFCSKRLCIIFKTCTCK